MPHFNRDGEIQIYLNLLTNIYAFLEYAFLEYAAYPITYKMMRLSQNFTGKERA